MHIHCVRDLTGSILGEIQLWTQRGCQWLYFLDQCCSRVSTLRHTTYARTCCIEPKINTLGYFFGIPRRLEIFFSLTSLPLERLGMKLVGELEAWPKQVVQRASLNSLRYGGANAHAIVECSKALCPPKGRKDSPWLK
jgi:hypothetical protein